MCADRVPHRVRSFAAAFVFCSVALFQLFLVSRVGTDIPFHDQWDIEGRWLVPEAHDGSLAWRRVVVPHNEHRIVWTHLLNAFLLQANGGQWDPLLQQASNAVLHGAVASLVVWFGTASLGVVGTVVTAIILSLAFVPIAAWHNALWGFQSQAYFVLGFSLLSLALLGRAERSPVRTSGGLAAGVAALFAMGPGALVPVALLGLTVLKIAEARRFDQGAWRLAWPALVLLAVAVALRTSEPAHDELGAATLPQFLSAAAQVLGWPHGGQPLAALALNLPLLLLVGGRLLRRRSAVEGEDFVLGAAGWSVGIALATAWVRGGSDELAVGVPSRYVDFVVLLPLANLWCVVQLVGEARVAWKRSLRLVAAAWCAFLFIGWLGLTAQVFRGIILPRVRDREAPVRLIQAFQRTGDPVVFRGQPRLLIPHPNLESVRAVLEDPRLQGVLPPSLQPDQPVGPLSRFVRWGLRRESEVAR